MADEFRVRRAPSEELRLRRIARSLAAPFNEKISSWQPQVALVVGMVRRGTGTNRETSAMAHAEALRAQLAELKLEFQKAVSELPDDVVRHDRLVDTQRAIDALAARIDDVWLVASI